MDPRQLARLTDWQLHFLYLKPQADRVEAMRREMAGLPPKEEEAAPLTGPPPRWAVVGFMVDNLGIPREAAEAEYDRQLALWDARKAGPAGSP